VADLTGMPEMMDGRVKTLHPAVHGGLLADRDNAGHLAAMETHGIGGIGADYATCVENIDIGGPAMIRAAAKNHGHVAVIVDPEDYEPLLAQLDGNDGATSYAFRQSCAQTAYARTAAYDASVSSWMAEALALETPRRRTLAGTLTQTMRYGENPHQGASFYTDGSGGLAAATQVQGKALSYNNINDTDAAIELVADLGEGPAVAIIKHANPCGVATGGTLAEAYERAYDCDRTSAFGGIVALNGPLDADTAKKITQIFTEVVIAPGASVEAQEIFAAKPNLRLLLIDALPVPTRPGTMVKQVWGGFLAQSRDNMQVAQDTLKVVTKRAPSETELADLMLAWRVAKHVKSNAIIYTKDGSTVGIGAGQMSRIDSTIIAARKSEDMAEALGLPEPTVKGCHRRDPTGRLDARRRSDRRRR